LQTFDLGNNTIIPACTVEFRQLKLYFFVYSSTVVRKPHRACYGLLARYHIVKGSADARLSTSPTLSLE